MTVGSEDPDALRAQLRERWDAAAAGWAKRAAAMREVGMPVSAWMLEQLALQPGQRVLELASGPGDTGLLAAELVQPGGTVILSDASDAMLSVARERAAAQGVENVELRRLELEWIDLPAASVDAVLCRWGLMLAVDPAAAARECRRVLRPGGRIALAVWDEPGRNPWATLPTSAVVSVGLAARSGPDAPGLFALADAQRLYELLGDAGFVEVVVASIDVPRAPVSVDAYLEETIDLRRTFAEVWERCSEDQRRAVKSELARLVAPYKARGGAFALPGSSLAAAASA